MVKTGLKDVEMVSKGEKEEGGKLDPELCCIVCHVVWIIILIELYVLHRSNILAHLHYIACVFLLGRCGRPFSPRTPTPGLRGWENITCSTTKGPT